jgi:putative flippase GtrA
MSSIPPAIAKRFVRYISVGFSTFLLDMFLVYAFKTYADFPNWLAVALGFAISVTINFLILYHIVYRGTTRTRLAGYIYFTCLATVGMGFIVMSTLFLLETFALNLYVARTIVASMVGLVGFLINTFFNFKMPH